LKYRARERSIHRMREIARHRGTPNEFLEDIRNDNEKIRGERVPLPKSAATGEPTAGHSIQKNCSFAAREDTGNPSPPAIIKSPGMKNGVET